MLGHEVDVVGDEHEVADLEVGVHAARRIAHKEVLDAQLIHDTHGEGHLLHVVTLVVVEAALQGHDLLAAQAAEDEFARVSLDCRHGEVGYVIVGEGYFHLYFLREAAQPRAEHDGGERPHGGVLPNPCSGFLNGLQHIVESFG